jgi:acyl carrier protein
MQPEFDTSMLIVGDAAVNDLHPPEPATTGNPTQQSQREREVAELIVNALQLEVAPGEINPEERMFGEGLGLDSIDALELALAITRAYGFELRSDDERNHQIFASLRSLTRHIEAHRTR